MHAYRFKVGGRWREFDLRSLTQLPASVLTHATDESLMWEIFSWGMHDFIQGMLVLDAAPMRLIREIYDEWQKDSQIEVEEIWGLLTLIGEHGGALEADLLAAGLRLRDCPSEAFSWRDLWVFVTYADVNSHIVAATNPERAGWDKHAMLLATIADDTGWLHWAKTQSAADGGMPPDRIIRPGVLPRPIRPGSKTKPMTVARVRELAGLDKMHEGLSDEDYQRKLERAFR